MDDDGLTNWGDIQPTVWHRNAYDNRLYLMISPSGKTHIAKWNCDLNTEFCGARNYEYTTLCNRTFSEMTKEELTCDRKYTKWHRPSPFYHHLHNPNPDGFLGVTCPRCVKLKPGFSEPYIEIDHRPHESELCENESIWDHCNKLWTSDIIPQVIRRNLRRCETCDRTCPTDDIEKRRKDIVRSWHYGYSPDECKNWMPGIYAKLQDVLQLTDYQLRNLSRYRLNLIYKMLVDTDWKQHVDINFHTRVLKIWKEKVK